MVKMSALTLWLAGSVAFAESPLFNAKAYLGPDGARAIIAMVKPVSEARCVMYVTGTLAEIDSLVLPCTTQVSLQRLDYSFTQNGRDHLAGQSFPDGSLSVFGRGAVIYKLKYNDDETQKVKVDDLWAKQQAQKRDLDALARFDRAAELVQHTANLKEAVASTNSVCGTQLTATMDSSALSDDDFKNTNGAASYCTQVLGHLKDMCERWKVARTTFQGKLRAVQCRVVAAPDYRLTLSGTTLVVDIAPSASDITRILNTWLREAL